MALKDLVKKVRLSLDRKSAEQMERDTKKSLSTVDKGLASLKKAAIRLGAALAAAFAVRAVVNFGKEVVRVAAEAEAIWNRLGQAVENVGVSFKDARPEIEQFARAMQDATTVGDEDFAAVMTELLTTSNDYAGSLRNVGVVADLAAAKQIDLRTAAQLVGRAMIGEIGTFKRYGIIIEEGQDAMEVLRQQFRGFAETDAKSLEGRIKQLNNEWSDFKQALGDILIVGGEANSVIVTLRDTVKTLTEWLNENRDALAGFGQVLTDTVGSAIMNLLDLYAKFTRVVVIAAEAQQTFLDTANKALGVVGLEVWKRIYDPEEYQRRLETLKSYVEGIEELLIRLRTGQGPAVELPPPYLPRTTSPGTGGGTVGAGEEAATRDPNAGQREAEQAERLATAWANLNSEMAVSPENAAKLAEQIERTAAAAELGQMEMMKMSQAADVAGSLMAGVFGGNIGEIAKWKAEQNAIMAAEQLAMGVVSSLNPITAAKAAGHYAAAKMFAGVAAAWGALAAATGGGRGGGGGASAGPRDVGGAASERSNPAGPEVNIYLQGDFDALNPRVQRVVYGAIQEVTGRNGNAQINIRRNPRVP